MSQSPIEFKGSSFTLSVVHLHHTDPETVRRALAAVIKIARFFVPTCQPSWSLSPVNTGLWIKFRLSFLGKRPVCVLQTAH